ncbi:Uncharacterized protein Cus16_0238 [Curtobacterium sp. ER1/6]|nr:Uncharacterized protein Cus16_0238 [Curtobacterium sp. ER1/6]
MHDVAEPLDGHELGDRDGPGTADLLQVVAREVDEHEVLRALLRVGEQLLAQADVLDRGAATGPRPGDRVRDRPTVLHLHERLGRRADDPEPLVVGVREREEVHVRARVEGPQHPVDVERVGRDVVVEPLRDDDLEDVAVADEVLRPGHRRHVVVGRGPVPGRRLGDLERLRDGRGARLHEVGLHAVEPRLGVVPHRVGLVRAVVEHARDEQDEARAVVERGELGDEGERLARHVEVRGRHVRQVLELAHGLPPDEADGPADERRRPRHARGRPALVQAGEHLERGAVERVDGAGRRDPGVDPCGAVVLLRQHAEAPDTDERPPRPQAALAGGLEQERPRTTVRELAVDADRRLAVRVEGADDRDDAVVGQQAVEVRTGGRARLLGAGRGAHRVPSTTAVASAVAAASGAAPGADAVTGSSGSTSKQRCAPVWHAAPTWCTVTSRVSSSQSSAAPRTYWACPEVSPLRQYSCRERDQKVTRPSVRVRRRASRSIQPSMRTSFVDSSCTMAGSKPSAPNRARSRTASVLVLVLSVMRLLAYGGRSADRVPGRAQRVLDVPDGHLAPVEDARGEDRVRTRLDGRGEVLDAPRASRPDDGDRGHGADRGDELEVEALLRAVRVDRVDEQLAGAALDALARPGDRVQVRLRAPAVRGDDEARGHPVAALDVERQDDRLRPEAVRDLADQGRTRDRGAVHTDLVRTALLQARDVVDAPDAAADRERDEDLLGRARDRLVHRRAVLDGRSDVEEGQFVRTLLVVPGGELDRVAGVLQVEEVDALHDPATRHVETRDDPDGHAAGDPGGSRRRGAHRRAAWIGLTRIARAPRSYSASMMRLASSRGIITRTADQSRPCSGETVGDSMPDATAVACSSRSVGMS